jgi:hypothetical protein
MRSLLLLVAALAAAPDLRLLQGEYATRKYDELYASGTQVWMGIATFGGTDVYLYDETSQNMQRVRPACGIDSVEALDGDGARVYVGDRSGNVFRLTADRACERVVHLNSRVRALAWDAKRDRLWIAADEGLYAWTGSALEDRRVTSFKPRSLRVASDALWVGTDQGLWKLVDEEFRKQALSTDLDRAAINAVEVAAGQIWFGNHTHGLHRWRVDGSEAPVRVEFGAKQVASLLRYGTSLLIGSERGLFRVNVADTPWDAKIRVAQIVPGAPRPDEHLQLKWEITNYEDRTSRELVGQRVEVLDGAGQVVGRHVVPPAAFELVFPAPPDAGAYQLRFVTRDFVGRESVSAPAGAGFHVQPGSVLPASGWAMVTGALLLVAAGAIAAWKVRGRGRQTVDRPQSDGPAPAPAAPIAAAAPTPTRVEHASGPPGASQPDRARTLKVFMCHSSGDKPRVRQLYAWLKTVGVNPWLDEEDILPGQDFEREITVAVETSDAVLVCLSRSSVSKAGYVQKEMRFALDVADRQPEGTIFLIPVKLEACEPPLRLSHLHWVDLFDGRGHERLLAALRKRADALLIPLDPPPTEPGDGRTSP